MRTFQEAAANNHIRFGSPTVASSSKTPEAPRDSPSRPASTSLSRVSESLNIRPCNQARVEEDPKDTSSPNMDSKTELAKNNSEANSYTLGSKDTNTSLSHISSSSLSASDRPGMCASLHSNPNLTQALSSPPTGELGHPEAAQAVAVHAEETPAGDVQAETAHNEGANAEAVENEAAYAKPNETEAVLDRNAEAVAPQDKGKQPILGRKSRDPSSDPPKYKNIARNKRNKKQSPAKNAGRHQGKSGKKHPK